MKVTVKTLKQTQFQLDIDAEETVLSVKQKIVALYPNDPVERIKLIFSGKILVDENLVGACGIQENGAMVMMVTNPPSSAKAKAAEAPKPPASAAAATTTTTTTTKPVDSAKGQTSATAPSLAATSAAPSAPSTGDPSLVMGAAYEEAVKSITDMGFPRDQVILAMKASFNNPDRAVEYLTNGIPEGIFEGGATAASAGAAASQEGAADQPAAARQVLASDFDLLRLDPQIQQLRAILQQNPQMLPELLERIGRNSPELYSMIMNHREEFVQLMNEGSGEGGEIFQPSEGEDELGESGSSAAGSTQYIQVTEAENAAIERLVGLGFERARVIEAYFACDKNEDLAANFLFESNNDEDF